MSAQTLRQIAVEDIEEGSFVDLQDDYIADPDQDQEFELPVLVESVEQETEEAVYVTFIVDGEELGIGFPTGYKLKVISQD
jgi:hypothetical protein